MKKLWVYKNIKTNNYIRLKYNYNNKTGEIIETIEEISDISKADKFVDTYWTDEYWKYHKHIIKISYEKELRKLKLNKINND